jgi:hypothetical protein
VNLDAQRAAAELPVSPFREMAIELDKLTVQLPLMCFRREFADQLFDFLWILKLPAANCRESSILKEVTVILIAR